MYDGKSLTVNIHEPITITSRNQKIESKPVDSIKLNHVKNIRVIENTHIPYIIRDEFQYKYPTIQFEFVNGQTETYKNCSIENLGNKEADIEVYIIGDNRDSDCYHQVEKYMSWAVWENTYTDNWGNEQKTVQLRYPSNDKNKVIQCAPMYRGVMAKYPDGEIRKYGNFERHSSAYKSNQSHMNITDSNTFNLFTSKGKIKNVVNVIANEKLEYTVHTKNREYIEVDKIHDAEGSFYTICLNNKYTKHDVDNIESYINAIGWFKDKDKYVIIGKPNSTGVHGGPKRYQIQKSNVEYMHIKKPDGDIIQTVK